MKEEKEGYLLNNLLSLRTIVLNRPLPKPRSITPTDFLTALERKSGGTINRDQQVKPLIRKKRFHSSMC